VPNREEHEKEDQISVNQGEDSECLLFSPTGIRIQRSQKKKNEDNSRKDKIWSLAYEAFKRKFWKVKFEELWKILKELRKKKINEKKLCEKGLER